MAFEQANEGAPTTVSWNVQGHDSNAERAFHVHQFGDNTNGCTSAGPHCMFLGPARAIFMADTASQPL